MIKKILISLILLAIIIGCTFFPMNENWYNFKFTKTLVLEDFEENDGTVSTLYPWVIEGGGIKIRSEDDSYITAYAGDYCLELSGKGSISLEIEASENQFLSFFAQNDYSGSDFKFSINSNSYLITNNSYESGNWLFRQQPLLTGSNRIKWIIDDDWDEVYLDHIKVGNYYNSSTPIDFETDQSSFESNKSFVFNYENSPQISTNRANSGSKSLSLSSEATILLIKTSETKTLSLYYYKSGSYSLKITINNSEISSTNYSTTYSWAQFTYSLNPGTHSLELKLSDSYYNTYIDDIELL